MQMFLTYLGLLLFSVGMLYGWLFLWVYDLQMKAPTSLVLLRIQLVKRFMKLAPIIIVVAAFPWKMLF